MKKIAELTKKEKVYGERIGVFLQVYNTVVMHEKLYAILGEEEKSTVQFGMLASNLYLLFVLLKEYNYLNEIEKTLESAFSKTTLDVNFEIIESECKNLNDEDKIVTLSTFRNSIAHGGFKIAEYGDQFYIFENNIKTQVGQSKKIVFKMPFHSIQYLIHETMRYIKYNLDEAKVFEQT